MSTEQQAPANGMAIQKVDPQQTLKSMLERMKPALAAVLPKHVTADRMLKVVLSATARQPKLLECSTTSIVRSVMQAGELGLEVGGLLGEAYLVPYNNKVEDENGRTRWEKQAQCIPGYKGLIKLARQSGQIASINAVVVYAEDKFRVLPAEDRIEHEPDLQGERDDENIVAVYAIARFREGGQQIDYMTFAEVEKIRKRSKSAESGPWVTDFAEMARKTVVRRLCKYLPLSAELAQAIELDNEHDARERGDILTTGTSVPALTSGTELPSFAITEPAAEEKPKRGARLAASVRAKAAENAPATGTATPAAPADMPAQPTKGGSVSQQVEMLGGVATIVDGQVTSITPKPAAPAPSAEPVIPSATPQPGADEEKKKRLDAELALIDAFPNRVGVSVLVSLVGRDPIQSITTSFPQMHQTGIATVGVKGFEGPIALSTITALDK